jgi:hypothetical protein
VDPIAIATGQRNIVQRNYHRYATGGCLGPQCLHYGKPVPQIQTSRWFVQQDNTGLLGKSTSQDHPLPLASGEAVELSFFELCSISAIHGVEGDFAVLSPFQFKPPQVGVSSHQDCLQGGERVSSVVLWHKGYTTGTIARAQAPQG